MPSPVLQFKRGPSSNVAITSFRSGEPGFTTDRYDFYIGLDNTTANNKFFGSSRYWSREDGTSALKLNLVDKDGSKLISLKSPDTISGAGVTYTFPETIIDGYVLKTNSTGTLEWSNTLPGSNFSGIVTFTDTTDSTAYTNGAVQIAGGLGVSKSVNIGGNIYVSGISTFTGFSDFNGGIDVLGNSEFDYVTVSGITTTGTLKLSGTSGIGITGISLSTTLSENSNTYLPTQAAVKAYVDAVDLTLGLNADTGGPSTVNTSQTLTINGTVNEVNTSVSGQTVTVGLPDSVTVTTALTTPTVKATNVQANDGTASITITNGTGAVGFANSVTISGDLYVLGNTTEVNTSALKVEDTLIDLGLVNNAGSLVPPSSDLNLDIGILFNWYNGSAKKASVYWDDSLQRVGIASDVTESTGVLTANAYAAVQIKELWVTDCAGTSQVISCTSSQRFLENITVDCGAF